MVKEPAVEEIFIIWPPLFIRGIICSVKSIVPIKFTSSVFLNLGMTTFVSSSSKSTPALLIKISIFLPVFDISAAQFFMLSAELRSSGKTTKFSFENSGGDDKKVPMTKYPSARNFSAKARPIPLPIPVIKTVCIFLF